MSSRRKICVVTGTRAEYGLLYWFMKEVAQDPALELQIIATGTHLSSEFGFTAKVIENDGFKINYKIDMDLVDDSPKGVTKSLGLAVGGFAEAFNALKPDIVVVLGDRYELLAAAQAALVAKIPMAHLHGGETTEGAFDEAIRHSITKMSHFHFVAHEVYKKRVIQLGENPDRVFNFGTVGLDHLGQTKLFSREELEEFIQFKLGKLNFLVTYHPVTLGLQETSKALDELLTALDQFPEAKIIFTKSNSDTDGKVIGKTLDQYSRKNLARSVVCTSLGQRGYLSAINEVDVVIGNSSSGIIEVPSFNKPTVNVGPRQKGRLRAASVIDCDTDASSIVQGIRQALSMDFRKSFENKPLPYQGGNVSKRIKDTLKGINLEGVLMKSFYDL